MNRYPAITPTNAKRILRINQTAMDAMRQIAQQRLYVPSWGIADVSKRIAECEAVLAQVRAEKEARRAA